MVSITYDYQREQENGLHLLLLVLLSHISLRGCDTKRVCYRGYLNV